MGSGSAAKSDLDHVDAPSPQFALRKALAHVTRIRILAAASSNDRVSPVSVERETGIPLGQLSFHFKVLVECGALEPAGERQVRGAVEHFYRGVKRAIWGRADLAQIPDDEKKAAAGAVLVDLAAATASAIESGSLFAREDFVLSWEQMQLDETGWRIFAEMLALVWKRVARLKEEASVRIEAGAEPVETFLAIAGFEARAGDGDRGALDS
jgi:DNA-binding transcriptional ArsR family regulator